MASTRKKPFGSFQKLLIITGVLGAFGGAFFLINVSGSTQVATTVFAPRLDDINSGLVGHWTFDGNDRPQGQVNDRSGQGNHGSMVNMSTSSAYQIGVLGQALRFDGVDDYVLTNVAPNFGTGSFSYTIWTKVENGNMNNGDYISGVIEQSGTHDEGIFLGNSSCSNGQVAFKVRDTDSSDLEGPCSVSTIDDSEWHFVAGINDAENSSVRIYIDGVEDNTAAIVNSGGAKDFSNTPIPLATFNDRGAVTGFTEMQADDFRIYDRALSADEMKQLYQLGGGR